MLSVNDIKKQSQSAYKQWANQWRDHAKIHSSYPMHSFDDFAYTGIGKAALCVASGFSFEKEIETIKKYKDNVDIVACDKSLGHLLDHGIIPKFCVLADANVNYEAYLEKWKDKLTDTYLFANVCGNPKWTSLGNWKKVYFFAVQDVLESEKEFQAISGCPNTIVAGTNVSNAMVIAITQSNNSGRNNLFGYDKILLIGFDFSWDVLGSYYAFDKTGSGKCNYMRHGYFLDHSPNRNIVASSTNLLFSAKWLDTYINNFKLPVIQCTRNTILATKQMGVLSEQMQYNYKRENSSKVINMMKSIKFLQAKKKELESQVRDLAIDHYYSYMKSV